MADALSEYIRYYRNLEAPGFAVLLRGAWGVGKTFQLRRALQALEPQTFPKRDPLNHEDHIYVSLFGIQSRAELDAEVIACSGEASLGFGGLRAIGNITRGMGGIFAAGAAVEYLVEPLMRRTLKRISNRLLVIDDLERSGMKKTEVLTGALNFYIEHLGFKVIVIAHDDKLEADLTDKKEKIIGQTITVQPDVTGALKSFIGQVENIREKSIVSENAILIEDIFRESKVQSLRILRQVVFDIARLLSCLSDDLLSYKNGIDKLIATFSAMDFLVRSGKIKREDILIFSGKNYYDWKVNQEKNDSIPNIMKFNEIFNGIDIISDILSPEMRIELLIDGKFDPNAIEKKLRQHQFFSSSPEPAWQIVWKRFHLDDDVVLTSISEMEKQFAEQFFTDPREILQVCALRISLASENLLGTKTIQQATSEAECYINKLSERGDLEPLDRLHESPGNIRYAGSFGLSLSGLENPQTASHVKQIYRYLFDRRMEALKNSLSEKYQATMGLLRRNQIDEFIGLISKDSTDNSTFQNLPIFAGRDPEEFIDLLLELPGRYWYPIAIALDQRYEIGLQNDLGEEESWLRGLFDSATKKIDAEKTPALTKARLRYILSHSFFSNRAWSNAAG